MRTRKRLTRQESKEVTRTRLIEAAEALFIRKGFEGTSVDEISERAGYSRGAFYSNFDDKEQLFLAVIDRRRPKVLSVLHDIFQQSSEPADRIGAVRDWFSNLWRLKDFAVLQMEFTRSALRDRSAVKCVAEIRRRELDTCVVWLTQYLSATAGVAAGRPEIIAVVLWAVTRGLGALAIDLDQESEIYTEAARLLFDRMTASQNSQLGTSQC
jgi:AcrR family transcriptional regulator